MPNHKPASDSLPAASDVLPKSAQIIPLPGAVKAKLRAPTRITKVTLSKLVCPPGQSEAFYWDSEIPGLGLRVYPSGRRTWLVQYRDAGGRTRRTPIGQASAIEPAAARKLARDLLTRVAGEPTLRLSGVRRARQRLLQTFSTGT